MVQSRYGRKGVDHHDLHVSAVFSKQNFPNQNTRKTIAGILYVYVIVVVCWGNGKPWTTTAAYLLYYQVLTLSSRLAPAQRTQDDTHYQVYFTWSRVLILLLVYYLLLLKKCPKSKVKKHSFAINYTFIHRISHSSEWFQAPEYICLVVTCLLYTSPSPRDKRQSRMPSSA